MKCIIDAKEIFNKVKQYNEDLVFIVNSDDISYRNDVEVNDANFGYKSWKKIRKQTALRSISNLS